MKTRATRALLTAAVFVVASLLTSCSADPPDAAIQSLLDVAQPDGGQVTTAQAMQWYESIYGEPACPDRSDVTRECEVNELLTSRQVFLAPGMTTSWLDITIVDGEVGAEVVVNDITRPTVVSCFKVNQFYRVPHDDGTHTDSDTYEYPCYFLTPREGWPGGYFAAHMGTLLKDGTIGLSPAQQCRIDYPAMDDISARSDCTDANEWTTAPDW